MDIVSSSYVHNIICAIILFVWYFIASSVSSKRLSCSGPERVCSYPKCLNIYWLNDQLGRWIGGAWKGDGTRLFFETPGKELGFVRTFTPSVFYILWNRRGYQFLRRVGVRVWEMWYGFTTFSLTRATQLDSLHFGFMHDQNEKTKISFWNTDLFAQILP